MQGHYHDGGTSHSIPLLTKRSAHGVALKYTRETRLQKQLLGILEDAVVDVAVDVLVVVLDADC